MRHIDFHDCVGVHMIIVYNTDFELTNSIFYNNPFTGVMLYYRESGAYWGELSNNVWYGNTCGTMFFSMADYSWGNYEFVNNIVVGNGGGALAWGTYPGSDDMLADYNDVWNNTLSGGTDKLDGEGNVDVNPSFTDAAEGDFTLRALYSSCIDAGDPYRTDPDGSRSDMGAFGGPYGDWDPALVP